MAESTFERSQENPEAADADVPTVRPEFAAMVEDVLEQYGELWEALADADAS